MRQARPEVKDHCAAWRPAVNASALGTDLVDDESGNVFRMLQMIYVSSATAAAERRDIEPILAASRRNNSRHGITGLLYADGKRFLQVLEGPQDAVEAAFARIKADPRHNAVVTLSRRSIEAREFGEWAMAERRPDGDGDAFLQRIDRLTRAASPNVRATFQSFVALRSAA